MIPDLQTSLLCDDVADLISQGNVIGKGTFAQRSRLVGPDGTSVVCEGQSIPITLPDENQVATTVEVFANVQFQAAGPHWVEVQLEQQLRLRYPLHVRPAPAQPPPGAPQQQG